MDKFADLVEDLSKRIDKEQMDDNSLNLIVARLTEFQDADVRDPETGELIEKQTEYYQQLITFMFAICNFAGALNKYKS